MEETPDCYHLKYVFIGDAANKMPPFTIEIPDITRHPSNASLSYLSELTNLLDHGLTLEQVDNTRLSIEVPNLTQEYVFIMLPVVYSANDHCYISYIYAVKVEDGFIEDFQIDSILIGCDRSTSIGKAIPSRYCINVYRKGRIPVKDGHTRGAVLYVSSRDIENELDDDNQDDSNQPEADSRDGPTRALSGQLGRPSFGLFGDVPVVTEKSLLDASDYGDDVIGDDDIGEGNPITSGHLLTRVNRPRTEQLPDDDSKTSIIVPTNLTSTTPTHLTLMGHGLVHVFNEKCDSPSNCQVNDEIIQKCLNLKECYDMNTLDGDSQILLKNSIRKHADTCSDDGCKIPHRYAGCLPPNQVISSSSSEENISPPSSFASQENISQPSFPASQDNNEEDVIPFIPPVPHAPHQIAGANHQSTTLLSPNDNITPSISWVSPVQETVYEEPNCAVTLNTAQRLQLIVPDIQPIPHNLRNYSHGDILYFHGTFNLEKNLSIPKYNELNSCCALGKGGNGKVIKYKIEDRDYALKYTEFRNKENEIWRTLSHENLMLLLGTVAVKIDNEQFKCCQIMELMTSSLKAQLLLCPNECLLPLLMDNECIVQNNFKFIFKHVLNGLNYLDTRNIELQDLKASNILVYKTCDCPHVYLCTPSCSYEVKISDFDSMQLRKTQRADATRSYQCAQSIHRISPAECGRVPGTLGNRAPEHFMSNCQDICGPWCDMWGLGILMLDHFLSKGQNQIQEVSL
jgi:hypothetical protein